MLGKPVISLVLLVIGGVVLDEIHPVTAAVKGRQQYLIHKNQVGLPLEVILLVLVNKFGVVQAHRTKNLLGVVFPWCGPRGLGWLPRRTQVACNVGVCRNEASSSKTITAPSFWAFFLDWDRCSASTCVFA